MNVNIDSLYNLISENVIHVYDNGKNMYDNFLPWFITSTSSCDRFYDMIIIPGNFTMQMV